MVRVVGLKDGRQGGRKEAVADEDIWVMGEARDRAASVYTHVHMHAVWSHASVYSFVHTYAVSKHCHKS